MKKIMWENWNEKEIELADGMGAFDDTQDVNMDVENELFQVKEDMGSMGAFLTELKSPIIYTPFGLCLQNQLLSHQIDGSAG